MNFVDSQTGCGDRRHLSEARHMSQHCADTTVTPVRENRELYRNSCCVAEQPMVPSNGGERRVYPEQRRRSG